MPLCICMFIACTYVGCPLNCFFLIYTGMGLGTKFARQVSRKLNSTASAVSSCGSSTGDEVDGTRRSSEECTYTVRALYSFSGSNEDEVHLDLYIHLT